MTRREYLYEDLPLIRRYFPGAKTLQLTTPFDVTTEPATDPWELRDDNDGAILEANLHGDLSWNQ
ncbi:MAG TPA: hypothetical protein VMB52_03905 [Verrucomicrobiae bacterium]|nr:hypothetical protein [Verrucomicrobiae bacterium]